MIAPEFEGKGLMSEALLAALQYGFGEMKLHSVIADINPSNERSRNLLLKFHFQREAYFRENIFYNGAFIDTEIYTLLKSYFNPA
jgi:ribosomal-protein-alanine N-acetyltransferase